MFFEISIENLTTPFDGAEILKGRYWHVKNGKVLVFINHNRFHPQCNQQKSLMDFFQKKEPYNEYDVKIIPLAYISTKADFYKDKIHKRNNTINKE